jgi:hypothetical protein
LVKGSPFRQPASVVVLLLNERNDMLQIHWLMAVLSDKSDLVVTLLLKCHKIFNSGFFMNQFPQATEYPIRAVSNFFENSRRSYFRCGETWQVTYPLMQKCNYASFMLANDACLKYYGSCRSQKSILLCIFLYKQFDSSGVVISHNR